MTAALTTSFVAPVFEQGAAEMGAEQRQHDHPVEREQEAARRRIVDRDDAAFRRGGPQEGAKQQVEGAPVEQRLEDLLAEQMADALGIADAGQHDAAGDEQRDQGHDVEQQGRAEGARAANGRPGGRWSGRGARFSARRTMVSAARPATTMPSSSRNVRPSTMSGSCIRCRPSAGMWSTVKSTRSVSTLRKALSAA